MAQQQSDKLEVSLILDVAMALHRTGIASVTCEYFGSGDPLHRFEMAQQQYSIRVSSSSR